MHVSQDQLFMMNVQNQCCQFFKILIKKGCFFFTKGGWSSLPRGWGVPMYNWKSYLQFEKIKS